MPDSRNFRLFVIGASAGGIEAIRELLSQLPAEFPAPILVVIHVPTDSAGQLDSVLQRSTKMVVQTAVDGARLLPRHVYVARPTELCSSRSQRNGHDFAVKRYELRSEESRQNAMVIRRLLTSEPQEPRQARPLECVEEEQEAGD